MGANLSFDFWGEQAAQAQKDQERAAYFRALCYYSDGSPVLWVAPWDTADGMKKGETRPGFRCFGCGQIEPNLAWLQMSHGMALAREVGGCSACRGRRGLEDLELERTSLRVLIELTKAQYVGWADWKVGQRLTLWDFRELDGVLSGCMGISDIRVEVLAVGAFVVGPEPAYNRTPPGDWWPGKGF